MRKGFTVVELAVVIGVIAIISAVLIPMLAEGSDGMKEDIVNIYNGQSKVYIDYDTGEELKSIDNYELVSVEYKSGTVIMYMRRM